MEQEPGIGGMEQVPGIGGMELGFEVCAGMEWGFITLTGVGTEPGKELECTEATEGG